MDPPDLSAFGPQEPKPLPKWRDEVHESRFSRDDPLIIQRSVQRNRSHINRSTSGSKSRVAAARRKMLDGRMWFACPLCHREIPAEKATVDHIIPRGRGGTDAESNLRLMCSPCNNAKADSIEKP